MECSLCRFIHKMGVDGVRYTLLNTIKVMINNMKPLNKKLFWFTVGVLISGFVYAILTPYPVPALEITVTLQDPNTENIDDSYVVESLPNNNFGTNAELKVQDFPLFNKRVYIKFNISEVPIAENIVYKNATLSLYLFSDLGTFNVSSYHVLNQSWNEEGITWNLQPCGIAFNDSSLCNITPSTEVNQTGVGWYEFDVVNAVRRDYLDGKTNVSFLIKTPEISAFGDDEYHSKEFVGVPSLRPKLEFTIDIVPTTTTTTTTIPRWNSTVYIVNASQTENQQELNAFYNPEFDKFYLNWYNKIQQVSRVFGSNEFSIDNEILHTGTKECD